MSSGSLKNGPPTRLGQGPHNGGAPGGANHLKDKLNARTSTPDSEALASSDDEGDHRHEIPQPPMQSQKPARRSSWLNDTSSTFTRPRKGSIASGSMSPTASHPSTPSAETGNGAWGAHAPSAIGRPQGSSTFPWGTGIWNTDRKDPSSRLSEVLPSPTSQAPPGATGNSMFGPDTAAQLTSPTRDGPNSQIPFAIPLHPTPKTYRSQSYSVGQMDPEVAPPPTGMSSSAMMGRARHSGLQHRPSRPSMLSEMANDGSMLDKVKEVEDDYDEESSESMQGSFHQSAESRKIEALTRENALLRQQQQQQQYNRLRPRASTGASYFGNGYNLDDSVPAGSDYAIDELDEYNDGGASFANRAANQNRRMSAYAGAAYRPAFGMDSRKNENDLKRALWSSSGLPANDGSQSRRHSFATMPTRQGSISSIADSASTLDATGSDGQQLQEYITGFQDSAGFAPNANPFAAGLGANAQAFGNPYQQQYGAQPGFVNRAPSPHRNLYGMGQPRHNQLLHIVLFKCARADVFYIQEGTGLTVKPGDLVIVEADRGTDLGTVAKDNVDWASAKDLKEHYAEEHYKWLMMYSQGAAASQDGAGSGLLASSNGLQGSAVGGMGPPTQHHMQEPNAGELRPKLIKRLAQSHEVHSLRDKEGQEAKAKRVCMQKVKEHALNMEILDAEFQMDWKKLTFYYFADAYINFNSLVTDLFKIYKTRIWMSAINPASFASPTLGIQAPSGVGPGAVGAGRATGPNERRQQNPPPAQEPQAVYAPNTQAGRGFRQGGTQLYTGDRAQAPPNTGFAAVNYAYGQQGGAFGNARQSMPYGQAMSPSLEGYAAPGMPQMGDFQSMRNRFPTPGSIPSPSQHSQMSPIGQQNDWNAAFQGLSLNSH